MFKSKKEISVEKFKQRTESLAKIFYVVLLSAAITALMVLYLDRLPSNAIEGSIALQDVRADQNYEITDTDATSAARDEASQKSPPVYNFDSYLATDLRQKIDDAFSSARQYLLSSSVQNHVRSMNDEQESKLKQDFLLAMGVSISDVDYKAIRKDGFSEEMEQTLVALMEFVEKKPIVQDRSDLLLKQGSEIVLRIISDPFLKSEDQDKIQEESEDKNLKKEPSSHGFTRNAEEYSQKLI